MTFTQYEQSGFIIATEKGFKLALDIGKYTPIEKLEGIAVDAFIVSHLHADHFFPEYIQKLSPKKVYLSQECIDVLQIENPSFEIVKIKSGETVQIEDIQVQIFDVDHGPHIQTVPKENFGFLFEIDGQKIYFAGDMYNPSGIDVTGLEVDTALVPVGGEPYTFDPQRAADFVKTFKKVGKAVPMHYKHAPETKEEFEKLYV